MTDTMTRGVDFRGRGSAREGGGKGRGRGVIQGPWTADFTSLTADERVILRGWDLYQKDRVRPLPLYPGVFHVGGHTHEAGSQLYTVDLRDQPTCGCDYFQHTQKVCKHIVAAVAWELNRA